MMDDIGKEMPGSSAPKKKPIRRLRWWMAGLLFCVSAINYIDRQTLSALAPILKQHFGWSNEQYGFILNAFRVSYTVMQAVYGRLLDRVGTRRGLGWSVIFYSIIGVMTALSRGMWSFMTFRFLLGAGEAANNPGGAKAISEWFPARERAWAIAFFNSGCAVGAAMAPWIALGIYKWTNDWRPPFIVAGVLGFVWLALWLKYYHAPEKHPRISREELDYIVANRSSSPIDATENPFRWWDLLRYRQAWGIIVGRFLLDPYWFFVSEWFAVFLKSKGFSMQQSILGSWVPFGGALLGNIFAGWLSSYLVRRGYAVGRSRRLVLGFFGPSMLALSLAAYTDNYYFLLFLGAYTTFAYNCCGTMFLTLPTDVFHTRAVGTVMGLGGFGAGIGTLISTQLIGMISDQSSFKPIILVASVVPCLATIVFVTLVRANKKPDKDGILLDF